MTLRPYQQQALEAVRDAYRRGHRSALVVMPTGTGKTVLFAEISRLAKGPVLVIAHRQELVETATPDRVDRVPLGAVFKTVAFDYDMRTAIREGFLCPIRSFLMKTKAG
jgi:superfamily II DNA or RNA helicase